MNIKMGVTPSELIDEASRVRVITSDGTKNDYDFLVGADGINSWVRISALKGAKTRFVGQASWRFLVNGFPEITQWTVLLGRGPGLSHRPPRRRSDLVLRRCECPERDRSDKR